MRTLVENSPHTYRLVRWLDENGAGQDAGLRIGREALLEQLGRRGSFAARDLGIRLKALERSGVLHVTRTTVDGTHHSPRAYNLYRLLCTADEYESVVGPGLAVKKAERIRRAQSAAARVRYRDSKAAARRRAREKEPVLILQPPDKAEASVLARAYDSLPDEELVGW